MKRRKLLLISHSLPPIMSGVSIIIQRLFKCFEEGSYVVLTSSYNGKSDGLRTIRELPCRYYFLSLESFFKPYNRKVAVLEWMQVFPAILKGLFIIRREKITDIFIVPSSGNLLLTAYIMHLISMKSLSIYFLDLFAGNKGFKLRQCLSGPIEYLAIHSAQNIFVMSESLKRYYDKKYNICSVLLRHPVDVSDDDYSIHGKPRQNYKKLKKCNHPASIVFTGYVYEYQIDPLQNLAKAVNSMNGVKLEIYTSRAKKYIDKMGVMGKNIIYHGFVAPEGVTEIQQKADILFLPMAFNPPSRLVIATASPGKLAEYLTSGRPILVHAPNDAYISWYAKRYGWGVVVEKPDISLLRESIIGLINNRALQERLVKNALSTVRMHEVSKVAKTLKDAIGWSD